MMKRFALVVGLAGLACPVPTSTAQVRVIVAHPDAATRTDVKNCRQALGLSLNALLENSPLFEYVGVNPPPAEASAALGRIPPGGAAYWHQTQPSLADSCTILAEAEDAMQGVCQLMNVSLVGVALRGSRSEGQCENGYRVELDQCGNPPPEGQTKGRPEGLRRRGRR